jgi:ferredoxin/rubrerythrin
MSDEPNLGVTITTARCIGCGACTPFVAEVFETGADTCRIARQPRLSELQAVHVAQLNCPANAIKVPARLLHGAQAAPTAQSLGLFDLLLRASESVRWNLDDIPWNQLDQTAASPALRVLVREMAFSEHATYSATQKFMATFSDNVEFSQWLAVWFYEETRHPHALMKWLSAVGEALEPDFVPRGRVSTPFMRSPVGTMVTNLISEVTAAYAYHSMATLTPEPVLAAVAKRIAGDEARHATSFYLFTQAMLAQSSDPERGVIDALKVLHVWLDQSVNVTHPIGQMMQRLSASEGSAGGDALSAIDLDFASVHVRVTRLVGELIGFALESPTEVKAVLHDRIAARHARGGGPVA